MKRAFARMTRALILGLFVAAQCARGDDRAFRMGISASLMKEVNENDAMAALRTWMNELSAHANVEVDSTVRILRDGTAFARTFRDKDVDCATLTTEEFLTLDQSSLATNLLAERGAEAGDVYLLLVHERSGITNLASLKGRELLLSDSMRMSLGLTWLDVVLMREQLPRAQNHFGAITRRKKLSNVILPVFFRSAEVCLVPKCGFDAMVELNPQVGKQLRILAQAPRYVAGLLCFRRDYVEPNLSNITSGLLGFQNTTRGRQVLTLFQSDPIGRLPRSALASAIDLLEEHKRLCASNSSPPQLTGQPKAVPPPSQ